SSITLFLFFLFNATAPTARSPLSLHDALPIWFRIAREVTSADVDWDMVERLDGIDRAIQLELMGGVDAQVEAATRWFLAWEPERDRKSTRLNSSHLGISYAVFCLKKKKIHIKK